MDLRQSLQMAGWQVVGTYRSEFLIRERVIRGTWGIVWCTLFRWSPRSCFCSRRAILRVFGSKVGRGAKIYSSVKVFLPSNLTVGNHAIIGWGVDCYNVAPVTVGSHAIVSQYSHLCAATHDYQSDDFRLVPRAVTIGQHAWIAAGAFIGPGVTIGEGAVVGARAVVVRDVLEWTVVAGNPAVKIKDRHRFTRCAAEIARRRS